MVTSYNTRAQSLNLASTTSAVHGDLFDKANPTPAEFSSQEWYNFDLAAVGFAFHHFEDVVLAASRLRERLRPGGVLVFNDFLEGGDCLADEEGRMVEGSEGNHVGHSHGHGHGHGHGEKHAHAQEEAKQQDNNDTSDEMVKKMKDSIVVPYFTIDGVKQFLSKAGFVDIDVKVMPEKVYMGFNDKKFYRTILFARGRRPLEEEKRKSEL